MLEALNAGVDIQDLFIDEEAPDAEPIAEAVARVGVNATGAAGNVIRAISDTVSHQGVVAVAAMPQTTLHDIEDPSLVLVLESVRDPGNAGTLIRSAVAAGADAVVFAGESVDPYSPKTVRASAGSLFRVPIVSASAPGEWSGSLRGRGLRLIGADAEAVNPIHRSDLRARVAFVVGNEAWGLPDATRAVLDEVVRIPMPGPVASLNAAVAGSLLLFEAVRQREAGILESASDE